MYDDKLLAEQFGRGDVAAFDLIVEQYQQKTYNIALKMLGNPEDAFDIAQETFVRVYKNLSGFKGNSQLSTWIYRICANLCVDFLRKNKKHLATAYLDASVNSENTYTLAKQIKDKSPLPEEVLENKEMYSIVIHALEQLNATYKTAVILRDMQNFSYDEIAKILNCSLGTVKSRINRGRSELKKILLNNELFREQYRKKSV